MPPIRPELLDELLKDYQKPDDLPGQDGSGANCRVDHAEVFYSIYSGGRY